MTIALHNSESVEEIRKRIYGGNLSGKGIEGKLSKVIWPDRSGTGNNTYQEIKKVKKKEVINGIEYEVDSIETSEVYSASEVFLDDSIESYAPGIKNLKEMPGVRVDIIEYEDIKIRFAKLGNRLHTTVFGPEGVKSYAKNIISEEFEDQSLLEEEAKWIDALSVDRAVKVGRAMRLYSPITFQKFNIENINQTRIDEIASRASADTQNEIVLDTNRYRVMKREKEMRRTKEYEPKAA